MSRSHFTVESKESLPAGGKLVVLGIIRIDSAVFIRFPIIVNEVPVQIVEIAAVLSVRTHDIEHDAISVLNPRENLIVIDILVQIFEHFPAVNDLHIVVGSLYTAEEQSIYPVPAHRRRDVIQSAGRLFCDFRIVSNSRPDSVTQNNFSVLDLNDRPLAQLADRGVSLL